MGHLAAVAWFVLQPGHSRRSRQPISPHDWAGVSLICKLANEVVLYVRLPVDSLWCLRGCRGAGGDPGGKAEQVRWSVGWPQRAWLSPSRSWKTPLRAKMSGFDCPVVTAALGLISRVEMEWLGKADYHTEVEYILFIPYRGHFIAKSTEYWRQTLCV